MIIRPRAAAGIAEACDYSESIRTGSGAEFLVEVGASFSQIVRSPEPHSEIRAGVRHALLRRIPYSISHQISDQGVVVIGVFDSRRDPRRWRSRDV